ncbi:hypothetical protein [Ekhidna sp. To15]|uniref:hypothetical protein n=1 Tax=Ekhidna sp. To15 TaxID=3395267 RepID=UPI003F5271ED
MLEYNGYSFKSKDQKYVFKHSSIDSIGLSVILLIVTFVVIVLMVYNAFIGVGALVLSLLIFAPIVKRSKGKSSLVIDASQEVLQHNENDIKVTKGFSDIASVYMHSMFVDEYSSAFKSTSKEYQVTIGLEIDGRKVPLFKLIADHAKPSKEMNAVHDFLETVIRKNNNLQHSQAV